MSVAALTAMRIFSVASFILYVLGVPVLYASILIYGQRNKLFSDSKFQSKFGFMYGFDFLCSNAWSHLFINFDFWHIGT